MHQAAAGWLAGQFAVQFWAWVEPGSSQVVSTCKRGLTASNGFQEHREVWSGQLTLLKYLNTHCSPLPKKITDVTSITWPPLNWSYPCLHLQNHKFSIHFMFTITTQCWVLSGSWQVFVFLYICCLNHQIALILSFCKASCQTPLDCGAVVHQTEESWDVGGWVAHYYHWCNLLVVPTTISNTMSSAH